VKIIIGKGVHIECSLYGRYHASIPDFFFFLRFYPFTYFRDRQHDRVQEGAVGGEQERRERDKLTPH